MTTLVFLLEEPSAKAMLEGVLPKVLPPACNTQYMVFEGKQDLHKRIVMRLQHWQKPDSLFVIMRDQDSDDCRQLREELTQLCIKAGRERSALIRIACHELESFYLGDLAAVERGLGLTGLAKQQGSRKFRDPDLLGNPSEELKKLTADRYQKLAGSRAIAPHLKIDNSNRSYSFNKLINGVCRISAAPQSAG